MSIWKRYICIFLSTLSLRRATPHTGCPRPVVDISIHALLAESDTWLVASYATGQIFLSTLSLRRATDRGVTLPPHEQISIHALLAESDFVVVALRHIHGVISIHALLAESDHPLYISVCPYSKFLSTLSLRRATRYLLQKAMSVFISIHALLAESDA